MNVPAGILAWVCPGLGHILIGQRRRGVLIMTGVLFLFTSGVLVGGVDVVDRRNDFLWFLAQSCCGPVAFGVDYVNQTYTKRLPADWTGRTRMRRDYLDGDPEIMEQLRYTSVSHVNEIGTLFCALAGLMNLAIILDALYFIPRTVEPKPGSPGFVERRAEAQMLSTLAYIPFLTPINALQEWWYLLLLPLAFGISMIYKALRMPTLDRYWRQVALMTTQIVLAIVALAIALVVLVNVVIPRLPAE